MTGRTLVATALGGFIGCVIGLAALAAGAALTIQSGLAASPDGPLLVVGRGSSTLLIMVSGALAGGIVAGVAYGVARLADPTERRYSLGWIIALGAVTGSIVAFASARAATGALANSISEGFVTIGVQQAGIAAVVTGLITGLVVGGTSERMSRPEMFGFSGEAWPATPGAFFSDAARAIGISMGVVVVVSAAVFGFSRFLLAASHTEALIGFSVTAALILIVASAVAGRKPKVPPSS